MRQLASAPAFLSLLLTIPLWVVFGNFIVALIVALLIAFLVAMCHSLLVLKRNAAGDDSPTAAPRASRRKKP